MTGAAVRGRLFRHAEGVRGHVYDPSDLARRLAVELLVDGWVSDLARADAFAPEAAAVGDGCYGFGFRLPESLLESGGTVEVRLANSGEAVGDPLRIPSREGPSDAPVGRVAWTGGLRLSGWVAPGDEAGVTAVVERHVVAEVAARGWTSVRQGALRATMAAFHIDLPEAFADGRVHRVTVLDRNGRELAGSPCPIIGFRDGLRSFLLTRGDLVGGDPRIALIEKVVPQSLPFAAGEPWNAADLKAPPGEHGPIAVALIGAEVTPTIESLHAQDGIDWVALHLPSTSGPGTFEPAELLAFLDEERDAAVVVFALAGTRLRPGSLARLGEAVRTQQAIAYGDATEDHDGGRRPLLWPAYDAERQLEQGYAALVFAAPAAAVVETLRGGASSLFALFLGLPKEGGSAEAVPVHLPHVLSDLPPLEPRLCVALARASAAHSGAAALPAPDAGFRLPAVQVKRRPRDAGVAVVVPDGVPPDLGSLARRLPRSVTERVVVSHRGLRPADGWRNIVVAGWRNPARLRNAALAGIESSGVLLLDAGVEPVDASTVAELAGRLGAGGVAAVSGLLMTPDGVILAAGAVLGMGFSVAPAYRGVRIEDAGYGDALRVARSCGALDASCLMVERAAAAAAGGFDELRFPEIYGGIDLSLKLRAAGHRLLVTPHARFVEQAAWREPPEASRDRERDHLRGRWGEDLVDDPFYHPALNRDGDPFTGLAWPPLPQNPRRPERPRSRHDDLR